MGLGLQKVMGGCAGDSLLLFFSRDGHREALGPQELLLLLLEKDEDGQEERRSFRLSHHVVSSGSANMVRDSIEQLSQSGNSLRRVTFLSLTSSAGSASLNLSARFFLRSSSSASTSMLVGILAAPPPAALGETDTGTREQPRERTTGTAKGAQA